MLMVGTVLSVVSGVTASAASAADPAIGTWTLNVEKSAFSPGPGPKSATRTYAQTSDGLALTYSGVAADGSAFSGKSTFKYDGKDYPITGSPDYDAIFVEEGQRHHGQERAKEGWQGSGLDHAHCFGARQ